MSLGDSVSQGYQSTSMSSTSLKSSVMKSQSVYLVKHKVSSQDFLMKISKLKSKWNEFDKEKENSIEITKAIISQYIVKVYYELKSETKKYLIYDYLPWGLLCNYFAPNKPLQEDRIKYYAIQILWGKRKIFPQ